MIKNDVFVRFVRGQEDQAENFASELAERGMAVSTKKMGRTHDFERLGKGAN